MSQRCRPRDSMFRCWKSRESIVHSNEMVLLKKIVRPCLLMLIGLCFAVATASLRAQEPAPQPPPAQNQPSHEPSKERSFARQLTHKTREAAGEEKDDKAEFKESPSVQFIAKHTGLSNGNAYLLSILLNFAVIAGLIFWAARKYLPAAFSARTSAIQKAMQEAQKASEEARRRLAEIESRLMKLDGEIGMMRDAAEKDAAAEEARIQAAAQEDARKIVESAQQEIASAAKSARRELTAYAADLAIALAKKQIHVAAGTDQALVRNFAGELGSYSDISGKGGR
jgi:F-type H+-transporting ATPase subunit b